jgi:eukaryotic-like serine/threonine-protein kinase
MRSADSESFTGTDRFVVQRRLGAGSFGVVYEVLDRERNTNVALKTLRVSAGRTLYRFKQEFRALADVSHPNLVTLYELLAEGEQWFFTMELIDGVAFLDHVRGVPSAGGDGFSSPTTPQMDAFLRAGSSSDPLEPLSDVPRAAPSAIPGLGPMERLRRALLQLGQGVCALHAAGKLHRDIKPSNVLVTGEGRVVLLDFGLIREIRPGVTHTIDAVGTPAYMSPEQASERPLTESSDWYSVGVMLYEALTGALPFTGPVLEVLRRKQLDEPPAPSTLVAAIPDEIDDLCRSLLRRAPGQRASGAEFLRRLRRMGAPETEVAPAEPVPPPAAPASPFVGRAAEMARLREAYATVKSGYPTTVSVHGGSGIGKTALVRRFLAELRPHVPAPVILYGRCYERESVPYKALDSVVDALSQHLRRLDRGAVEALLPHDVVALARLFPVLRQVPAVTRARRTVPEIPDSQELRRRAFAALRELFVRLADRSPVVIVMDDLQWGDADSAALLTDLMKPPDSPAILLVGCYRTEEAKTSDLLSVLLPLRESPPAASLRRMDIALGELAADEAQALATELLGAAHDASRARAIARESQGNPFLIDALARFGGDELSGTLLDEMIRRRAAELAEPARRLLTVVAVAGRPIDLGAAFHAAALDHESDAALAALRAVHFVRTRRSTGWDEVETYHDRLGTAVTAGLAPEELRRLHERLALALLASGRADPERLAEHFREGGHLQQAADHAVTAATAAASALAFDRAARLYRLALSLRPEESDAHVLRVRLGDALANAGRGREAAEAYLDAATGGDTAERIDLRRRAAHQLLIAGHVEEGLALVKDVLARVGISMPSTTGRALVSLMLRRAVLRGRGTRFRRRDAGRVPAWDLLRIDTCWSVAVGFGLIDLIRSAEFQTRSLQLALRAGEPYRVARCLALDALFVSLGGTRVRARVDRLLASANGLATDLGNEHAVGLVAMAEGVAAWVQGRWKDALRLCDEAAVILRERCVGATWETDNAEMYALSSLFMLGEIEALSRRLPRLLERAEERGNLLAARYLRVACFSHVAWLAADDPDGARSEIAQGVAPSRNVFDFTQLWLRGAQRDIALYTGEGLEEAAPLREGWRRPARALDRFPQAGLILSLFSRARRRVALGAAGAGPAAAAHLDQADRHARDLQSQRAEWGDAFALLILAGAAATRGRRERALEAITEAAARLDAVHMALFATAARRARGELLGGEAGSALIAEADAWMTAQSIRRPDRMARMLAPGAWRSV